MATITQGAAQARADTIRNETGAKLNTAERVGSLLRDIVDSVMFAASLVLASDDISDSSAAGGPTVKDSLNALAASVVAAGVASFNTRVGAVVAAVGDYAASQITNDATGSVAGAHLSDALASLAPGTAGKIPFSNGSHAYTPSTFTTDGSSFTGLVAVNGERVAIGALGPPLADGDSTISVSSGSVFEQLTAFTANHTVKIDPTGSTEGEVISIRRHVIDAYTLTVVNNLNVSLYQFPAGVKRIADFPIDWGTGQYVKPVHQKIQ